MHGRSPQSKARQPRGARAWSYVSASRSSRASGMMTWRAVAECPVFATNDFSADVVSQVGGTIIASEHKSALYNESAARVECVQGTEAGYITVVRHDHRLRTLRRLWEASARALWHDRPLMGVWHVCERRPFVQSQVQGGRTGTTRCPSWTVGTSLSCPSLASHVSQQACGRHNTDRNVSWPSTSGGDVNHGFVRGGCSHVHLQEPDGDLLCQRAASWPPSGQIAFDLGAGVADVCGEGQRPRRCVFLVVTRC